MRTLKIAVTVPEDVVEAVDAAAREKGMSRSGLISRVLRTAMKAKSDAEVTRKLDEIFTDPDAAADQLRIANELDRAGTDWSDESW
jgi:hypothetical protein